MKKVLMIIGFVLIMPLIILGWEIFMALMISVLVIAAVVGPVATLVIGIKKILDKDGNFV